MSEFGTQYCPNCGAAQPENAARCSNCGFSLAAHATLSISRAEIDEREVSLRVIPDQGNPYTILVVQRTLNVGSDPRQEMPLQFPGVAPRMARLVLEGTGYRLYDLTTNPGDVLVNNSPVDSHMLKDGDAIRLQDGAGRGVTLTYSNPVERAMGSQTMGRMYPFEQFPFTIGRDPSAMLKLDALAISWHHAIITEQGNAHFLTDLDSTNGTFVNDRGITAPCRLQLEDVIRLDQVLLVYKGKGLLRLPSVQRFQLDAIGLEMTYQAGFPTRHTLNTMRDVSLSIQPQEFVAVIGGSGSGKSTLLRALNGANRATGGQVLVNADNLYENYELYQPVIGYVPQQDIVHDKLTVYQSLWFGSRLRFPNEPAEAREQRINRVLDTLDLTDFRDRQVGRLSGGQKKRVSIALELMAEPRLLFMDEPTSGLDPGLDKSMMDTLRRLANRGHVVVVVTHTTLNIGLCDQLVLMSRGSMAYFGPPRESLNFFGVKDFPEIYNRVQQSPDGIPDQGISPVQAAAQWAQRFKQTALYAKYVTRRLQDSAQKKPPAETALSNKRLRGSRRGTFWQQVRVLTDRSLTLALRDIRTMIALVLVLPLVGLFLGLISLDSVENTRGQMLVDRFKDKDILTFLDKLPLKPADAGQPPNVGTDASAGQQSTGTKAPSNVKSIGTYTPASEAQRLLFMLALAVTLLGIFASAYTIVEEKSLFLRERMVNLRIAPYLTSKIVVYGGFSIVSALLALITMSFGVQLPDQGLILWGPLEIFITLALTALAGVSIGLLLSALNRQLNGVTYAVLGVLFIQILFAGVLFEMNGPLEVPSRVTVTRWALEALGGSTNIVSRNAESRIVVETIPVNRRGEPLPDAPLARQPYPAPSSLSVTYPSGAGDLAVRWAALLGFSIVFLVGASLALNRSESF
jgi:ABC-type multidrug transport system ATPase subunit